MKLKSNIFCGLLLLFLLNSAIITADTIITIAGSNMPGFAGDNGPAVNAAFNDAISVAVDNNGCLYIADCLNYRVRKIDTNGIITTIAGTGDQGYNGDSIPAVTAQLFNPIRIAVDNSGNIYISDGNRICKINTNGIITTIAGAGEGGNYHQNILAVNAQIAPSPGLAVDKYGNIYISDNGCVYKINTDGMLTLFAGHGRYRGGEDTLVKCNYTALIPIKCFYVKVITRSARQLERVYTFDKPVV